MSVTGTWTNSYGSVMELQQLVGGMVTGTYQSSTGSTGKYFVVGMANMNDPTPQLGQSVALAIYWRSYEGGPSDPSWHWVSGLSGQLDVSGAQPTIYLMHAMVATCDFPGLADAGTYVDKLVYTPKGALQEPAPKLEIASPEAAADPISGIWVCRENPGLALGLALNNPSVGYVTGNWYTPTGQYPVLAFTDVDAQSAGLPRQGLSVTVGLGTAGTCQSMAGSLEFSTGVLTLTVFDSRGTAGDAIYVQTKASQLTFSRNAER
ncbi:MAG TPA: avidin/streptavidin family protein [Woeseiaceae bacterium]|nr:avidin/streptavidin family protein [Woeseiaceae bacterium]